MGPFCYLHTKKKYEANVAETGSVGTLNEGTVLLRIYYKTIQGGSKRWTQFRTSIFPELYKVCE